MAIYYNTTEIDGEELLIRMKACKSQNMRVYELIKEVKTLWRWKLVELYQQFYGVTLQESVAGRALSTLCSQGYLFDTGEKIRGIKGAPNNIYQISDTPPTNPITIPKKICVTFQFTIGKNGDEYLDVNRMLKEFNSKLNYYNDLLGGPEIEEDEVPEGYTILNYKLHDIFLKENPTLTHTNVGPRVGRYLFGLLHDGIIMKFEHKRDNDNVLQTYITVGSEPTEIQTFKDKMNEIIKQERKWSKIKV